MHQDHQWFTTSTLRTQQSYGLLWGKVTGENHLLIHWMNISGNHPHMLARWWAHRWLKHGAWSWLSTGGGDNTHYINKSLYASWGHTSSILFLILSHGGKPAQVTHRAKLQQIAYQLVDYRFKPAEEKIHSKPWWIKSDLFWATKIPLYNLSHDS